MRIRLYEIITSTENILLKYRARKANTGSKTTKIQIYRKINADTSNKDINSNYYN